MLNQLIRVKAMDKEEILKISQKEIELANKVKKDPNNNNTLIANDISEALAFLRVNIYWPSGQWKQKKRNKSGISSTKMPFPRSI